MSSSQNFLSRYAPDCTVSSPKMQKLPTVGGGTPPPTPSPPLSRFAPSGLVASLPRNIRWWCGFCLAPQKFLLITPLVNSIMLYLTNVLQCMLGYSAKSSYCGIYCTNIMINKLTEVFFFIFVCFIENWLSKFINVLQIMVENPLKMSFIYAHGTHSWH